MTEIYLHFLFAHCGLSGNAPVVAVDLASTVSSAGLSHASVCAAVESSGLAVPSRMCRSCFHENRQPSVVSMKGFSSITHSFHAPPPPTAAAVSAGSVASVGVRAKSMM